MRRFGRLFARGDRYDLVGLIVGLAVAVIADLADGAFRHGVGPVLSGVALGIGFMGLTALLLRRTVGKERGKRDGIGASSKPAAVQGNAGGKGDTARHAPECAQTHTGH